MKWIITHSMKYLLTLLFVPVVCSANPIVVFPDARVSQMLREEVLLKIGADATLVSGDYSFEQVRAKETIENAEFVEILVPVYVALDTEMNLGSMKTTYQPQVMISGAIYESSWVGPIIGRTWSSFWHRAKFGLAVFRFEIPRKSLPEIFEVRITYNQPHMRASGSAFACYCPFRPSYEIGRSDDIADQHFTLTAKAASGLKTKRISRNKKVENETAQFLIVHCLNLEDIVLKVTKN